MKLGTAVDKYTKAHTTTPFWGEGIWLQINHYFCCGSNNIKDSHFCNKNYNFFVHYVNRTLANNHKLKE